MDDVTIRPARPEDFLGVLKIDVGALDAYDRIPANYHAFLRSSNHISYVTEKHGEVVAFILLLCTDGGKTLLLEGGRTSTRFRSQNYIVTLGMVAVQAAMKKWPNATVMITVSRAWNHIRRKHNLLSARKVILLRDSGPDLQYKEHVTSKVQRLRHPGIIQENVSHTTLCQLLMEPEVKWRLFPHGFIVRYLEPFQLIPDNMPVLMENISHSVVSRDVTVNDVTSISVGCGHQGKLGYVYIFEYYGNDVIDAVCHWLLHMPHARRYTIGDKLAYFIYLPQHINLAQFTAIAVDDFNADIIVPWANHHVGIIKPSTTSRL